MADAQNKTSMGGLTSCSFCSITVRVLLVLLAWTIASVGCTAAAQPVTKQKTEPEAESKSEVVVSGHLSIDNASVYETVRFWLTIENRSNEPLQRVSLAHLDAEGFLLKRRCWGADAANQACAAKGESSPALPAACGPVGELLCGELAPHQMITVWGDLEQDHSAPKREAFAVVEWQRRGLPSQTPVALGPLESLSCVRAAWLAVTARWDLGIPFWIGVFSGIYAIAKSRREKKEHAKEVAREALAKEEERARKARDKKEAQELDQRAKTWNLLLNEVQKLALTHYMPIASTAQGLIQYLGFLTDPAKRTPDNFAAAFCYLIRFHWRIREMKRHGASWYFKNLTAEEIVVGLFQAHRVLLGFDEPSRQATLDGLLDRLNESSTLAVMMAAMAGYTAPQQAFYVDFQKWALSAACIEDIATVSAMVKVIGYETNRPLLYWYEERRAIPLNANEKSAIEKLPSAQTSAGGPFTSEIAAYLADALQTVKLS